HQPRHVNRPTDLLPTCQAVIERGGAAPLAVQQPPLGTTGQQIGDDVAVATDLHHIVRGHIKALAHDASLAWFVPVDTATGCWADSRASRIMRSLNSFRPAGSVFSVRWKPDFSATSRLMSMPSIPLAPPAAPSLPSAPAMNTRSGTNGWLLCASWSATTDRA